MPCFGKSWYGSVHESTSVCTVSQTPVQRIGLTNCEQTRHLCYAPPSLCIPCFGDLADTSNVLKNDSLYFLFDFPSPSGDLYTLEKYNNVTNVWIEVATLNNTQGIKYTFGDAIFNGKYENRSGYRIDSHLVISLYGEGEYRFVVKNTTTYIDSLFSTCFCVKNWNCDLAKGTTKIYTNFTGVVSDWKKPIVENEHNINCMVWVDSRRYYGDFIRDVPTKTDTIFIQSNNRKYTHKSTIVPNYKLELIKISREARDRLFNYGSVSRDIFATDYNEDTIGFSQHWTAITMPNTYSEQADKRMNFVSLVTIPCEERYDLIFDRCVSCEPPPVAVVIPDPIATAPFNPNATFIAFIDGTSFSKEDGELAEKYAFAYATELGIKYPDWTGKFQIEHIPFRQNGDYEQWLSWVRTYVVNKGIKDAVVVMFVDEAEPFYTTGNPIVTTVPTALYTTHYNDFVYDYNNNLDSFQGMIYAIPAAGKENLIPPTADNPNGFKLKDYYVQFQNHTQCAIWGRVITPSEFVASFQDTTNQLDIILTQNGYSVLNIGLKVGLKDYGWYEKHDFATGMKDLTYQQFKKDMNVMLDP